MLSNYEITRNKMREKFTEYDTEKAIRKFGLKNDARYIYISFMRHEYRIDRKNGKVEWSDNDFETVCEADFNESMTIYDLLCYSRDNCSLSGNYCTVNMLKGTVQSSSAGVGSSFFQNDADEFNGKAKELESACLFFGEKADLKGDVAAKLYPFSFLPVIIQYWEADDEFPANLKFMFDENILRYMHFETTFYLMSHMVKRIKEMM